MLIVTKTNLHDKLTAIKCVSTITRNQPVEEEEEEAVSYICLILRLIKVQSKVFHIKIFFKTLIQLH